MKKRLNADIRKPEILKNFYKLIIEQGFEGASIGKLAKGMNIHPSLIIHYFENKDNLTFELVKYVINEYGKLLKRLNLKNKDSEDRLKEFIKLLFSDEWYSLTDISFDYSFISLSFRNKKIHEKVISLYEVYHKEIAKQAIPFIETGIIVIKDPNNVSSLIISMVEGYRHFKHFYVEKSREEIFREEMITAVLAALKGER